MHIKFLVHTEKEKVKQGTLLLAHCCKMTTVSVYTWVCSLYPQGEELVTQATERPLLNQIKYKSQSKNELQQFCFEKKGFHYFTSHICSLKTKA